ncbi:NnrU family protein [Reinekea sp.]|jgi:uncharacterized membrane protein|uniref:NnrU family protein n=1 Tax=Reinekea sp. TaxID=1970455 RepID=UPI0039890FDE
MIWLIVGLVLWSVSHSIKPIFPKFRQKITDSLGLDKSKGLFSSLVLVSIIFIIYGWRHADPSLLVYTAPKWLFIPSLVLIFISIYLFISSTAGLRYRQWIRHPQLLGLIILSGGHLLTNGEVRSIILFAGFAIWALITIPFINQRDGTYVAPTLKPIKAEIKFIVITIIASLLLIALHGFYTASPLIGF